MDGKGLRKCFVFVLLLFSDWRGSHRFVQWSGLLLNEMAAFEKHPDVEQLAPSCADAVWEPFKEEKKVKAGSDGLSKVLLSLLGGKSFLASRVQLGVLTADAVFVLDSMHRPVVLPDDLPLGGSWFSDAGERPVVVMKPRLTSCDMSGVQLLQTRIMQSLGWCAIHVS